MLGGSISLFLLTTYKLSLASTKQSCTARDAPVSTSPRSGAATAATRQRMTGGPVERLARRVRLDRDELKVRRDHADEAGRRRKRLVLGAVLVLARGTDRHRGRRRHGRDGEHEQPCDGPTLDANGTAPSSAPTHSSPRQSRQLSSPLQSRAGGRRMRLACPADALPNSQVVLSPVKKQ